MASSLILAGTAATVLRLAPPSAVHASELAAAPLPRAPPAAAAAPFVAGGAPEMSPGVRAAAEAVERAHPSQPAFLGSGGGGGGGGGGGATALPAPGGGLEAEVASRPLPPPLIVHGGMSTMNPVTNIEAWRFAHSYFRKHPPPVRLTALPYAKPRFGHQPTDWWVRMNNAWTGVRSRARRLAAACPPRHCTLAAPGASSAAGRRPPLSHPSLSDEHQIPYPLSRAPGQGERRRRGAAAGGQEAAGAHAEGA